MSNKKSPSSTTAKAIIIGDRFFCGFGKGGRVKTAWSLAGATLFQRRVDDLDSIIEKIMAKGKQVRVVVIAMVGDETCPF